MQHFCLPLTTAFVLERSNVPTEPISAYTRPQLVLGHKNHQTGTGVRRTAAASMPITRVGCNAVDILAAYNDWRREACSHAVLVIPVFHAHAPAFVVAWCEAGCVMECVCIVPAGARMQAFGFAWVVQAVRGANANAWIGGLARHAAIAKVKACCTAPSLNPNMKPQKNKARPKRPQFFLPGLLKVALFPGHWCAWNRRRIDPPRFEKARQCVSLHTNAVLAGRGMRAHAPRSGDRKVRRLKVRRPMWVRRPGPETKRTEATNESAERLPPILAEPCIGQCRVGGWVSNETAGLGQG